MRVYVMLLDEMELAEKREKRQLKKKLDSQQTDPSTSPDMEQLLDSVKLVEDLYREEEDQ